MKGQRDPGQGHLQSPSTTVTLQRRGELAPGGMTCMIPMTSRLRMTPEPQEDPEPVMMMHLQEDQDAAAASPEQAGIQGVLGVLEAQGDPIAEAQGGDPGVGVNLARGGHHPSRRKDPGGRNQD